MIDLPKANSDNNDMRIIEILLTNANERSYFERSFKYALSDSGMSLSKTTVKQLHLKYHKRAKKVELGIVFDNDKVTNHSCWIPLNIKWYFDNFTLPDKLAKEMRKSPP